MIEIEEKGRVEEITDLYREIKRMIDEAETFGEAPAMLKQLYCMMSAHFAYLQLLDAKLDDIYDLIGEEEFPAKATAVLM